MGNWNINIQGVGSHHNVDNPTDANRMAVAFVEQLVLAGHYVETASFTNGAKDNLLPVSAVPDAEPPNYPPK